MDEREDCDSWLESVKVYASDHGLFQLLPRKSLVSTHAKSASSFALKVGAEAPAIETAVSTEMDFRFLNLNNEPSVRDCISAIDMGSRTATILMGCSGCGKTSTLFTVASQRYCIFLQGAPDEWSGDLTETIGKSKTSRTEDEVLDYFLGLLLARLANWCIIYATTSCTPLQWLLYQVEPAAPCFHSTSMFDFFSQLSMDTKTVAFGRLMARVKKVSKHTMAVLIDEVQALMKIVLEFVPAGQSPPTKRRLPRIWLNALRRLEINIVLSGTGLNHLIIQAAVSAVGKPPNEGISIQVVSSFRYFEVENVESALSSYFELDEEAKSLIPMLCGRARNTYLFITRMLSFTEPAFLRFRPEDVEIASQVPSAATPSSSREEKKEIGIPPAPEPARESQVAPGVTLDVQNRVWSPAASTVQLISQVLSATRDTYRSELAKALLAYIQWHVLSVLSTQPEFRNPKPFSIFLTEQVSPPSGGDPDISVERLRRLRKLTQDSLSKSSGAQRVEDRFLTRELLESDGSVSSVWYLSGTCFIHSVTTEPACTMTISYREPIALASAMHFLSSSKARPLVNALFRDWIELISKNDASAAGKFLESMIVWMLLVQSWQRLIPGAGPYCLRDALVYLSGHDGGYPGWLSDDLLNKKCLLSAPVIMKDDDEMLSLLEMKDEHALQVMFPNNMARPDAIIRFGEVLMVLACKQRAKFEIEDFCDNVLSSDPRLAFFPNPFNRSDRKATTASAEKSPAMCTTEHLSGGHQLVLPALAPLPQQAAKRARWMNILLNK